MQPHRITPEEKHQMTLQNMRQFVARNPDYYPSPANSAKLLGLWESQVGCSEDEWPYPVGLEDIQACYDHIVATSWFYTRPVETVDTSAQDAEQERLLKVANDNLAAARANEIRVAKTVPLRELRDFVGVENAKSRAQRSVAARTQTDNESNRLTPQEVNARAAARLKVMTENPGLSRTSIEFSKKVAAELAAQ